MAHAHGWRRVCHAAGVAHPDDAVRVADKIPRQHLHARSPTVTRHEVGTSIGISLFPDRKRPMNLASG